MSDKKKVVAWILILAFHLALIPGAEQFVVEAEEVNNNNSLVIVSLGDSYSAGEGNEPFYGGGKPNYEKVHDQDWCAHRSEIAWPGLLRGNGGVNTALKMDRNTEENTDGHWFFVAASGATTYDYYEKQKDKNYRIMSVKGLQIDNTPLDEQKKVWDRVRESNQEVDYVTMTFGGNDVGFADICGTVIKKGVFDDYSELNSMLSKAYEQLRPDGEVYNNLKNLYKNVNTGANGKAKIIVAGYPTLFNIDGWYNIDGNGGCISKAEARTINKAAIHLNIVINVIVNDLQEDAREKLNIYFVPVTGCFYGHEAFTSDPYINGLDLVSNYQDIDWLQLASSYSCHPNKKGQFAYASCVQNMIDQLEKNGSDRTVSENGIHAGSKEPENEDQTEKQVSEMKESDIPIDMDTYKSILDILPHLPKYNAMDYDTKEVTHPGIEKRTGKGYWDDWLMGAIFPALWWDAESICKQDSGGYYTYDLQDVIDLSTIFANEQIPEYYFQQGAIVISEEEEGQSTKIENGQLICAKKTGNEPFIEVESVKESGDGFSIFYRYSDGSGAAKDRWEAHFSLLDGEPRFEYTKYLGDSESGNTGEEEDWGKADYRAYADLMYGYMISDLQPWSPQKSDPMFRGYALRDINQDGIDELILVAGDEWNGYELLRMYTSGHQTIYPVIIDDSGKSEKYAFSGNKVRLWNTMYGSGVSGEAAFTFEAGSTGLTLVEAISCYAEKPPYVDNPLCYSVTNEDGKYNEINDDNNGSYFCFTDTPDESFTGKVISYDEYKKGIEGYDFTTLDLEIELLTEEAIQKVAGMAEE